MRVTCTLMSHEIESYSHLNLILQEHGFRFDKKIEVDFVEAEYGEVVAVIYSQTIRDYDILVSTDDFFYDSFIEIFSTVEETMTQERSF